MKVLYVESGKPPEIREIDGSLQAMQELVGGWIQTIYPFEDSQVVMVCNDEGKLLGLPLNRGLYDETGQLIDIIAGSFFLCAAPADSENLESLSEEEIQKYMAIYKQPQAFFKIGKQIVAVKL